MRTFSGKRILCFCEKKYDRADLSGSRHDFQQYWPKQQEVRNGDDATNNNEEVRASKVPTAGAETML